ncbi:MAG TPA: serine/threonine-protein kinase [Labilithrix sp.]|nr:serine/threonine-protein kinase [Labilithrix sp.]
MFIPPADPKDRAAPAAGRLAVGSVIAGKYAIEGELASGGVGTVVLAVHRDDGKKVAIKYLHSRLLGDRSTVERFKREARLVAHLASEHVVRVHEMGTLEDGTPYTVMEYLEGEDFGAIVSRGPVAVARAVDWGLQACAALAEVHALGVVHRDLKPENLFLARRSDGETVLKVLDFGISKIGVSSRKGMAVGRMTLEGERFGTPLYMSPEQLRSASLADARSDIWALGVVLYELLTAELPFQGGDLPSIISSVLTSTPRPIRTTRPDVPTALEVLVTSCLSRDPSGRPAGAAELAAALRAIQADLPRRAFDGVLGGRTSGPPRAVRDAAETKVDILPTPPLAWGPVPILSPAEAPRTRSRRPRPLWLPMSLGALLAFALTMTGLLVYDAAKLRTAANHAGMEVLPETAVEALTVPTARAPSPPSSANVLVGETSATLGDASAPAAEEPSGRAPTPSPSGTAAAGRE